MCVARGECVTARAARRQRALATYYDVLRITYNRIAISQPLNYSHHSHSSVLLVLAVLIYNL